MSMFYNNPGMLTYQDIQPFEIEFQRQMQQKMNILQPQIYNLVLGDWEQNKQAIVMGIQQSARQKYSYLNQALISQAIYNYIQQTVSRISGSGYTNAMPMGAMGTNPYVNGYRPMNGMGQPQMQYQAMPSSIINPMQPTMSYDIPQTQPTQTTTVEQQPQAKEEHVLHVAPAKPEFKKPINDEPDDTFGADQLSCAVGDMKITTMIDGSGKRLKYADIQLHDCCSDAAVAIERSKLMFDPKNTNYHIDITYNKLVKLDIPYDKFSSIIGQMRQAIGRASKAKNKLNYLKGITKILNAECRGIADAIERFLLDEFLKIARYGCVDSDHTSSPFGIVNMMDLIELSDKETSVSVAQAWQATPGFNERLASIVTETIRHIIMECHILDPGNIGDIGKIIRSYAGFTVVNSEGAIVDVIDELNERREEYCAASAEDKRNLFGTAGKLIADSTVIIIPDQKVVVTSFTPEGSLGQRNGDTVAIMQESGFGGKDAQGVPNDCTSTFEYLMTTMSLTEDRYVQVVVDFDNTLRGCFDCIKTTDSWYMLIPAKLN